MCVCVCVCVCVYVCVHVCVRVCVCIPLIALHFWQSNALRQLSRENKNAGLNFVCNYMHLANYMSA